MGTDDLSDRPRGDDLGPAPADELRGLWEVVPYSVYTFDRDAQRTVYANRHAAAQLGYSAEQVAALGENPIAKLMHPDDLATLPELLARWDHVADGEVLETEHRLLHADGTYRWFLGRDAVLA